MEQKMVTVIFDRRKIAEKRGFGYLEVRVNLGCKVRRYVSVCTTTKDEWETAAQSAETKAVVENCENILSVMKYLGEEMNIDNFNRHFYGEEKKKEKEDTSKKSFIRYMELALEDEELRPGSRKNKVVVCKV